MKTNSPTSLKELFNKDVAPQLRTELGLDNALAVPRVKKVVVNVGVGKFTKDEKYINSVAENITKITGQRPVKTTARKAIAGFKIRAGNIVGVTATLRGDRMYSFLERLVRVALPRVRDFRGLSSNGFDQWGNYNLGIKENIVFPESASESAENTFPMEVTIVTTAQNKDQGYKLLRSLGFPFEKKEDKR